jgi:hypothetical protein
MDKVIDFLSRMYLSTNQSSKDKFVKKYREEFLDNRLQMLHTLNNTKFYHGTGAYSYMFDTTKYDGKNVGIRFMLEEILTNGLRPQRDLFNDVFGTGVENTLSITESREYARCYSTLFMHEKSRLEYEYGSPIFWGGLMALQMMKRYKPIINHADKQIAQKNRRDYEDMCNGWSRSFRKDGRYEGKNVFCHLTARSDIEDNFGIVIGIKDVPTISIDHKFLNISEQRINTVVDPSEFTHIQAPIKYFDQVRILAETNNFKKPIIPIEYAELINSEMPIEELLAIKKRQ